MIIISRLITLLFVKSLESLVELVLPLSGPDIRIAVIHYTQMLRRHIVSKSEIARIFCRQIYRKHQHALDLIYEYRTDQQAAIQNILVDLIRISPN